jgi:hypothetical protein
MYEIIIKKLFGIDKPKRYSNVIIATITEHYSLQWYFFFQF